MKTHRKAVLPVKEIILVPLAVVVVSLVVFALFKNTPVPLQSAEESGLLPVEELGKRVFFDKISNPPRMACATCHDPSAGWTFRVAGVNKKQVGVTGANPHTVGSLKPPSNAYTSFAKPFGPCPTVLPARLCGGTFWDGRAEGNDVPMFAATEHIGDEVFFDPTGQLNAALKEQYAQFLGPIADQALQPFTNTVEQNIEREGVCRHVASSKYAPLFQQVWDEPIDCSPGRLQVSYKRIAVALSAWQASHEVNSFTSKRDRALQRELLGIDVDDTPGKFPLVGLTEQENFGHDLFYATFFNPLVIDGVSKFANCSICHRDAAGDDGAEQFQLYTDHGYHSIGSPRNPEVPLPSGGGDPEDGLGGRTGNPAHLGLFKTPTIRNVDKRPGKGFAKSYGHNGWFKSMESIVHFYNTADVTFAPNGKTRCPPHITKEADALKNQCWPEPAHPSTAPIGLIIGRLGLTAEDEAAIVAYLRTLTDDYTPKKPLPYTHKSTKNTKSKAKTINE